MRLGRCRQEIICRQFLTLLARRCDQCGDVLKGDGPTGAARLFRAHPIGNSGAMNARDLSDCVGPSKGAYNGAGWFHGA